MVKESKRRSPARGFHELDIYLDRNESLSHAVEIVRKLQSKGFVAYFAGGVVRDMLVGKISDDIDIATSAKPEEVFALFPKCYEIGAAFGIINIIVEGMPYEVATFREERGYQDGRHPDEVKYTLNPETDALRRDFTVNGMFYDPVKNEIHDFVGGQQDLARGELRTIGNPVDRFSEDYLRILRAIRFAVRFGLRISDDMPPAMSRYSRELKKLSAERIRDELNKMLTGTEPERAFRLMDEYGILDEVLPEISGLKGVTQHNEYHPEGDVFEHTMLMLSHMAYPEEKLAWAILLHDIGKPSTKSMGQDGIEHFYTHEHKSAEMAEKVLKRLKFPSSDTEDIIKAVRDHMRFAHVREMRPAKWKRLMAESTFPLENELHRIDCVSSHGKTDCFVFLLDKMNEQANEIKLPPPLVTGNDLISLGMKPGPAFKDILGKICDLQLEGKLRTREEALALLKDM